MGNSPDWEKTADATSAIGPGGSSGTEPAPPLTFRFPRAISDADGGGDGGETQQPPRRHAEIDVILSSHLPTAPGPWIEQYAAQLSAEASRPVALAVSDADGLRIDLLGSHTPTLSEASDGGAAIESVARVNPVWVIRAEGADPARLATHRGVTRLTLLTGATEPAVISAYRVIKSVAVERIDRDRAQLPVIRVAVMGAGREDGERVAYTLHETASTFLDEEVELAGCIDRLAPTPGRRVYTGGDGASAPQLIAMILAAHTEQAARPTRPPQPDPPRTPAPPVDRPATGRAEPLDLAALGGLEPLGMHAGGDEHALLAHDELGRLHVLVHDEPGSGLIRLLAAQAWARQNTALVAQAGGIDPVDDEPVAHLFVADPKPIAGLVPTRIRLHVLVPPSDPGGAWRSIDLN